VSRSGKELLLAVAGITLLLCTGARQGEVRLLFSPLCNSCKIKDSVAGYVSDGKTAYVRWAESHESNLEPRPSDSGHSIDLVIKLARQEGPGGVQEWRPVEGYLFIGTGLGRLFALKMMSDDLAITQQKARFVIRGHIELEEMAVLGGHGPVFGRDHPGLRMIDGSIPEDPGIACDIWAGHRIERVPNIGQWDRSPCLDKR
jgi:hypothetical protein